jgi:hypothetical protein
VEFGDGPSREETAQAQAFDFFISVLYFSFLFSLLNLHFEFKIVCELHT